MATNERRLLANRRYSAGRQLHELEATYSPFPSQFLQTLNDTLSCDLSPNKSFVPFLRERDSTGKLLRTARESRTGCDRSPTAMIRPSPPKMRPSRRLKLKRPAVELGTPGVGTYLVETPWIRRTYSTHKPTHSRLPPTAPTTPVPPNKEPDHFTPTLTPTFQYTVKQKKTELKRDKYETLRPEVVLKRVEKTNFQSVKLEDDPVKIMASFQFAERRQLKDEKLRAPRRFIRRMLKGKFY